MQSIACAMHFYSLFQSIIVAEQLFHLRGVYKANKKRLSFTFWRKTELHLFLKFQWPDAYICHTIISPVL